MLGPASSLTPRAGQARWFAVGEATILASQAGRLVEYDMQTRSAQGSTRSLRCSGCLHSRRQLQDRAWMPEYVLQSCCGNEQIIR